MLSYNNKLRNRLEYKDYSQKRFSVFVKIIKITINKFVPNN